MTDEHSGDSSEASSYESDEDPLQMEIITDDFFF